MTIVYVPMPLFPALTVCTRGLLEPLGKTGGLMGFVSNTGCSTKEDGFQYIFQLLFGSCMASVVWAFSYRLAILSKKAAALTSKCGIAALVLSQIFYETPTLLPFGISTRDTTAVQNAVFQVCFSTEHYPKNSSSVGIRPSS